MFFNDVTLFQIRKKEYKESANSGKSSTILNWQAGNYCYPLPNSKNYLQCNNKLHKPHRAESTVTVSQFRIYQIASRDEVINGTAYEGYCEYAQITHVYH